MWGASFQIHFFNNSAEWVQPELNCYSLYNRRCVCVCITSLCSLYALDKHTRIINSEKPDYRNFCCISYYRDSAVHNNTLLLINSVWNDYQFNVHNKRNRMKYVKNCNWHRLCWSYDIQLDWETEVSGKFWLLLLVAFVKMRIYPKIGH